MESYFIPDSPNPRLQTWYKVMMDVTNHYIQQDQLLDVLVTPMRTLYSDDTESLKDFDITYNAYIKPGHVAYLRNKYDQDHPLNQRNPTYYESNKERWVRRIKKNTIDALRIYLFPLTFTEFPSKSSSSSSSSSSSVQTGRPTIIPSSSTKQYYIEKFKRDLRIQELKGHIQLIKSLIAKGLIQNWIKKHYNQCKYYYKRILIPCI